METTHQQAWALVTGASGGIGRELARLLARDGHSVVLVARSGEKLEALAQELSAGDVEARVMPCDLARPEAGAELFAAVKEAEVAVDVLINNAGFATYGPFLEDDLARELQMIQLNAATLTDLAHRFGREMAARGYGRILNVASTAAFLPGPLMAVYYATKAYVLSFSEALAEEWHGTGVTVTTLCPGPTETGFQERADMEESKLFRFASVMEVETVARAGYEGLMTGKRLVVPGLMNKLGIQAVRLTPRRLLPQIVRRLQERRS